MDQPTYERMLFWVAKISLHLEDPEVVHRANRQGRNDSTAYNLALNKLRGVTYALGSQNPLWPATASRLVASADDLGVFDVDRAKDALKLPALCRELVKLVFEVTGEKFALEPEAE